MKNRDYWRGFFTAVLITLAFGAGIFLGAFHGKGSLQSVLLDADHLFKIRAIESLIQDEYLGDVDREQLEEGVYTGLVYGLGDPYSNYYTAEDYTRESENTSGSYTGIGITMQKDDAGVLVVESFEDGPGYRAGIRQGDVVTAVNGTDITGMELEDVAEMVQSSTEGVTLTVVRKESEDPLEIPVSLEAVERPFVYHEMLNSRTGYIRISEFMEPVEKQYLEAEEDLLGKGMEKLVVDLRGNPGGLLDTVCSVLENILPEGLIVYTEDKNGNRDERYCEGENPLKIPLAVLVDGNSASASEIFAGAVQDYGVGTIVGTTTYGKGVVQGITRLSDGSAVKLTISKYYTPKGNSIHGVGIQPDVQVEGNLQGTDPGDTPHEEDNQLLEALKVLGESL